MAPLRKYESGNGDRVRPVPGVWHDKQSEAIAVVGFSVGFPQDATTSEALWEILMAKRNTATSFPANRINIDSIYHPDPNRRGQVPVRQGHFLEQDLATFDASFFATSTTDAAILDPQQRLLLEHTYWALENAGIPMESISGSKTSVFTGTFSTDWMHLAYKDGEKCATTTALGIQPNFNANRVSWFFNLHGNSANIDTACSSSLVSLDLGCQSLRSGDEDMSIVAGSNVILSPDNLHALTNLNMLSPDGQCFSFDHRANGYSRGEGVGVLILKRVSDAIRDHDTIRGIIRSTGCNQDGQTPSITLPNYLSQENLINDTYRKAGLSMAPTRFFEAHGTGTQVGDPTEARAIGSAFRHIRTNDDPLWVGAIKSNIGHLEGASGIAGVIKALLVLEKGVIPPNANFERVNPKIDTEFLRIKFPTTALPWPTKGLRRASVNSFGNAGTNAHAILDDVYHFLEENGLQGSHLTVNDPPDPLLCESILAPRVTPIGETPQTRHNVMLVRPKLLVFSSNDAQGTQRMARQHATYFRTLLKGKTVGQDYIDDLVYTLSARRSSLPWKAYAILGSTCDLGKLDSIISPTMRSVLNPQLAFVFTGQGAQWSGMARELMSCRVFRRSLLRSEACTKKLGCTWTLTHEILGCQNPRFLQAELSQPMCTAIQIALIELLNSLNIYPVAVVGHSSGEIAAAYCMGSISHESAMRIAYYRGVLATRLSRTKVAKGAMVAVGLSREDAERYLSEFASASVGCDLVVACVNSPKNVTISGHARHIATLQAVLQRDRVFTKRLHVDVAYHSHHMQEITREYREKIRNLDRGNRPGRAVAMFSTVTGQRVTEIETGSPDYWVANLVSPVLFHDALVTLLSGSAKKIRKKLDLSHRNFLHINMMVEIGPHSTLQGPITDTATGLRETLHIQYTSVLIRNNPANLTLLGAVGQINSLGYVVDLGKTNELALEPNKYMCLSNLPGYPFDHSKRYWEETRLSKTYRTAQQGKLDLLGKPVTDWNQLEPRWQNIIKAEEMPWIEHHVINGACIYPGAGMLVMAIEAANQLTSTETNIRGFDIKEVSFLRPLKIPRDGPGMESQLVIHLTCDDSLPLQSWAWWRLFAYEHETWSECCCGMIRARYIRDANEVDGNREAQDELQNAKQMHDTISQSPLKPLEVSKFYHNIQQSGLGVGPPFQRILSGAFNDLDQTTVEIELYQWPEEQYPQTHVIHPATLDCMFHASFAGYTKGGERQVPTMIPTSLDHMFVSRRGLSYPAATRVKEVAWMGSTTGSRRTQINASALDISGDHVLLEVRGLRLTEIAEKRQDLASNTLLSDQLSYVISHQPDPAILQPEELAALSQRPRTNQQAKIDLYLDLLSYKAAGLNVLVIDTIEDQLSIPVIRTLRFDRDVKQTMQCRVRSLCILSASQSLLDNVKEDLGADPSITYQLASVDANPITLHLQRQSYDVVIASRASHQGRAALVHLRSMLKNNGKLFLSESIPHDGDTKKPDLEVQQDYAFSHTGLIYTDLLLDGSQTNDDTVTQFSVYEASLKTIGQGREHNIYIVVDPHSLLQNSAARQLDFSLKRQGLCNIHIIELSSSLKATLDIKAVFIVLLELDRPYLFSLEKHEFAVFRKFFTRVHDVMWIGGAGGSVAGKPSYQMVNGFARALRSEYQALRFTTVCLRVIDAFSEAQIDHVLRVFDRNHLRDSDGTEDVEYLEIDGLLNIPRLNPSSDLTEQLRIRTAQHVKRKTCIRDAPPLMLTVGSVGLLDTVQFVQDSRPQQTLSHDEVEIKVEAIGVNFKDCLIALGRLENVPLGQECSGTVLRVGASTDFNVGDRVVFASADVFRTIARCKAALAFKLPDNLSFPTAAAIPAQFVTAWTVIHKVARLQAHETILIHVGASGTGQAAIQIAQLVGAKVFTTVGSLKKKTLLIKEYGIPEGCIFYSRDTSFASGIQKATQGRGVDVIINSLAGDALLASWECIASNGRFIEIGKKDILSNAKLPMTMFERMASFHAFDGATWFREKQGEARTDMLILLRMFSEGTLRPAQPLLIHDIGEIEDVLKIIQAGTDPGKHVMRVRPDSCIQALLCTKPSFHFQPDASYVVAGGLGGIGRATTRFLAMRGARNLVLLSRYGPRSEQAHTLVNELTQQGIKVYTPACDITDLEKMRATFQDLSMEMPPVKGCVQASMLARDCIFAEMSYEIWRASIDCKAIGSWNLHSVLPAGMDFFLTLSSASGLAGIKGQANYDAANVYEDALARWRVAHGEKAVTLDLGAMIEDGILAETPALLSRVLAYGSLEPITRQKYYGMLDYFCNPALPLLSPVDAQVAIGLSIGGGEGLENYDHARQPMLRPLERVHQATEPSMSGKGRDGRQQIATSKSSCEVVEIVAGAVVQKLAKSLSSMQDISVDRDKPLQMHGVDSLLAIELRNWIVKEYDADLAVFETQGASSINTLSTLVAARTNIRHPEWSGITA